jgi:chromosomal replication initiator protein
VLTCDRLPRQLVGVEERLRERFESGLVASIDPPDLAVRVAILRKRVALDEIALADAEVLELIARRITDNVRALEGALIRIVAHHSLTGRPIDAALTAQVLDEIHPLSAATPTALTVGQIQQAVAEHFELTVDELLSSGRTERISWPRQLAILLARDLTGASLPELGRAFGGRNHATILHSCRRVAERVIHNPEDAHSLDDLRRRLAGEGADLPS